MAIQELTIQEIGEVSGGRGLISYVVDAALGLGSAIYYSGLNAREAGLGDEYLFALNGGNLGA